MSKLYDIDSLLEEVVTLPSMSTTVARLTECIDSPDCSMQEVARIISSDPAIVMKTLRLVNSAYYNLSHEVTTIEHAVVLLGARVVKNLALTATVFDSMSDGAERFLKHSAACGVAMGAIIKNGSSQLPMTSSDEAFLFGLLHDIGCIVLKEAMPEECEECLTLVKVKKIPLHEAEREIIGVDHAVLGGRLAEQWRLNKPMVDGITGHHDISLITGEYVPIAAAVGIADAMSVACGYPSHDEMTCTAPAAFWQAAGIDNAQIPGVMRHYFQSHGAITDFIRILS